MKKEKNNKKQRTSSSKKGVRLMCIILAILMVGTGIYYLIDFLVKTFS